MVVVGLIWDQYFCIYTHDTLNIVAVLKREKEKENKKIFFFFLVCEKTQSVLEKLDERESFRDRKS